MKSFILCLNRSNCTTMSEQQPSPPKRVCYNLRGTAARQIRVTPTEPQPGCSSDAAKVHEPEIDMEKNLMILVDDCFLKMFDFLNLIDLCQTANVNKRLNALVKLYIQTKYHVQFNKEFDLIPNKGRINVAVAQAFFHIFGDEIAKLKLRRDTFDETFNDFNSMYEIFKSLGQHCSNIKHLTLIGFGMGGLNCAIFKELEVLTLEKCSVSRDWCKMKKLKVLRMSEVIFRRWPLQYSHRSYGDPPIPPISIPTNCFGQLIEARLSDVNFGNDVLMKFLKQNTTIKALSVVKCLESSPIFFNALPLLQKLEEFEFKKILKFPFAFGDLHKLKNLKILKLSFYDATISNQKYMKNIRISVNQTSALKIYKKKSNHDQTANYHHTKNMHFECDVCFSV